MRTPPKRGTKSGITHKQDEKLIATSAVEKPSAICYTLNAMNKLHGLIFDVDGVIADTEAANAKASIKVFTDLFGVHGVEARTLIPEPRNTPRLAPGCTAGS